jgi:hypothetical protein
MARRRSARALAQPGSTRRVRRDRTDDAGPETGTGAAGTDTGDAADRAGCATRASGAGAGGRAPDDAAKEAHRSPAITRAARETRADVQVMTPDDLHRRKAAEFVASYMPSACAGPA